MMILYIGNHFIILFLLLSSLITQTNFGFSTPLGNETFQLSDLSKSFHSYTDGGPISKSTIPAWIITDSNVSAIHRFFDSSPFSPSGRYLALLRIAQGEKVRDIERELVEVVVYDLKLGPSYMRVISTTSAWDTQVGCHVQWGATDQELFYNVRISDPSYTRLQTDQKETQINGSTQGGTLGGTQGGRYFKSKELRGVIHNIFTDSIRYLDCPVYHVSLDGRYAVSPDLMKIQHTQLGYGVRSLSAKRNKHGHQDNDGLFIVDVKEGTCRVLLTLRELSLIGGLKNERTPTYGFHTKFSNDGQMILFVVRTLKKKNKNSLVGNIVGNLAGSIFENLFGGVRRVQHIFIVNRDGSDPRLVLSWGGDNGKNENENENANENENGHAAVSGLFDGNHPYWVHDSYNISMNFVDLDNGYDMILNRGANNGENKPIKLKYQLVVINTELIIKHNSSRTFHGHNGNSNDNYNSNNNENNQSNNSHKSGISTSPYIDYIHPHGSGHPSYHRGGRYVLMDAYPKERTGLMAMGEGPWTRDSMMGGSWIHDSRGEGSSTRHWGRNLDPGSVPLRLLDTVTGKEIWILKLQIERNSDLNPDSVNKDKKNIENKGNKGRTAKKRDKDYNSWRCDPHPVFSRDGRWISFNGRPLGGNRQVLIAYLGDDKNIRRLFE